MCLCLIHSIHIHDYVDNSSFNADEVVAFILAIEQHFYRHFRVKLSVCMNNITFYSMISYVLYNVGPRRAAVEHSLFCVCKQFIFLLKRHADMMKDK